MPIGTQPTKDQVDYQLRILATGLNKAILDAEKFNFWLTSETDAQLTALGYTVDDIYLMRSAFSDLARFKKIYLGEIKLDTPYDFRTFVRLLFGLGD